MRPTRASHCDHQAQPGYALVSHHNLTPDLGWAWATSSKRRSAAGRTTGAATAFKAGRAGPGTSEAETTAGPSTSRACAERSYGADLLGWSLVGHGSSKAALVDLVAAYSNRPDVLGDLEYTLAALAKAQAAAGRIEPVSVRSDRSTRSWKVSHRLSEEDVQLLTKEYRAGALRQELADKYKISLSSVGRLLRKHEARLKDNLP